MQGRFDVFSIEMLQANYGDAIWLEYGPGDSPKVVLIDCGFKSTYRKIIERIEERDLTIELLILTHIDEDHIKGAIPLLQDARLGPGRVRDIWFNGYDHMVASDAMGAMQGEMFSAIIEKLGYSWNGDWGGRAVIVPETGPLNVCTLPGGLKLTVLSPTAEQLRGMAKKWKSELHDKGLEPGDTEAVFQVLADRGTTYQPDALGMVEPELIADKEFNEDTAEPNGSSIAVLAEYQGTRVLLTGDAFPTVLVNSINRLLDKLNESKLTVNALKVAHHGSKGNTSPELLSILECQQYLVSTNGKKFNHPSPECIARIITACEDTVTVRFSNLHEESEIWRDSGLQMDFNYKALYPGGGSCKLVIA